MARTFKVCAAYMNCNSYFPYLNTQNHGFKSCAKISQTFPQAHSGYYWLKIGKRDAKVYCDMDNYGMCI